MSNQSVRGLSTEGTKAHVSLFLIISSAPYSSFSELNICGLPLCFVNENFYEVWTAFCHRNILFLINASSKEWNEMAAMLTENDELLFVTPKFDFMRFKILIKGLSFNLQCR